MKMEYLVFALLSALLVFSGCNQKSKQLTLEEIHGKSDFGPGMMSREKASEIKAGDILKAEKGYTVGECYTKKSALSGKTIQVRGKVIKFNPGIMDRNWIHIQDGTGGDSEFDLALTSEKAVTSVGKIILVSGVVSYDKNFGPNLTYPVIIEGAVIIEEK